MMKRIQVPKDIAAHSLQIGDILVERSTRFYRDAVLLYLLVDGQPVPITASEHGWVRYVAVVPKQHVQLNQLLLLVDTLTADEYRPDEQEVNLLVELGEEGRRGVERELQSKFAKGYAAALFDAPEKHQGQGQMAGLPEHPALGKMKESVPAKMRANAAHNDTAMEHFAEEASNDPELRKQLSAQLQQSLQITPTPSTAPQLKH